MQMSDFFFSPLFLLFEKRQWDAEETSGCEQISTTTNFKVAQNAEKKNHE